MRSIHPRIGPSSSSRRGYTLVELLAVVMIIGLLAGMSARFLPDSLGNVGASVDARRLARDLRQTRTRAISSGDNHRLVFATQAGKITGYTIYRVSSGGTLTEVDLYHPFSEHVIVTVAGTETEFDFEGAATGASQFTLVGPNKTVQVTLTTLTGSVSVSETVGGA